MGHDLCGTSGPSSFSFPSKATEVADGNAAEIDRRTYYLIKSVLAVSASNLRDFPNCTRAFVYPDSALADVCDDDDNGLRVAARWRRKKKEKRRVANRGKRYEGGREGNGKKNGSRDGEVAFFGA